MAVNPRTLQQKFVPCTAVNNTLTFITTMSTAFLLNTGSKPVWFTVDGTATGSDGDGRSQLPPGVPFSLPAGSYLSIDFVCAFGDVTGVQVAATQATQDGGYV